MLKLGESVKKETGFDVEGGNVKVGEFVERIKGDIKKGDAALTRFRTELLTDFVDWNRWERWKVRHLYLIFIRKVLGDEMNLT